MRLTNKLAPDKFSKVSGYKINIQNPVAFLYTNKKLSEREREKAIPFIRASKGIKIPRKKI